MTILHVSAVMGWGGGEMHIENLCYELSKKEDNVNTIILCAKDSLFHERLKTSKLNFIATTLAFKMDVRYAFKIIDICKKQKIDIIHIHDPIVLALITIADKFYNLPPFVFSKKTSFPIKQKRLTLFKYNYSKIKKYLCVSDVTKEVLAKSIVDKHKLITVYHGTNLDTKSSQTPFNIKEKFQLDKSKKIIGLIGNHIDAKDLPTFINVVNQIVNENNRKDIVFIQIGSYSELTEGLMTLVKDFNIEDNLKFLGYQANASNFIPQFDILLITSQSEGIPQAIYESFYHKVPVIATNVGGIPEIIKDGENGFLIAVKNHRLFSERIEKLLMDRELSNKFIELSHRKLISNFTTEMMANKTLEQYKLIINGH